MQQQDSYSDFSPMRQSSMLTDETLLMNGTDVYAHVSVVWPELRARELELERARKEFEEQRKKMPAVLEATLSNNALDAEESNEETIWLTALDTTYSASDDVQLPQKMTPSNVQLPQKMSASNVQLLQKISPSDVQRPLKMSPPEPSTDANNQSMFDVYRSVLDYMNKRNQFEANSNKRKANSDEQSLDLGHMNKRNRFVANNSKMKASLDGQSLDDTLPMDGHSLDDTLPMDDQTTLLNDTLPMDDAENALFDCIKKEKD